MIRERQMTAVSGGFMLLALLAAGVGLIVTFILNAHSHSPAILIPCVVGLVVVIVCLCGLFIVNPNEAKVLVLFGEYAGSVRKPGMYWANPFFKRTSISLRIHNFESAKLKVNDHDGNPIEIGSVVVWQVVDTAEACFEVDNYDNYVHVQSESALRSLATSYPYDAHQDGQMSLRANTAEVAAHLQREIEERLAKAGVKVLEARITHLAYAPEIAQAMLQRQQASAIVAARILRSHSR